MFTTLKYEKLIPFKRALEERDKKCDCGIKKEDCDKRRNNIIFISKNIKANSF